MEDAIDIRHLEQYVGDDAALRDEILTIFEDQASGWLARLDPSSDDESWKNAAHALKGASRGIGAFSLGDLCEEAEALVDGASARARREALLKEIRTCSDAAVQFARRLRG